MPDIKPIDANLLETLRQIPSCSIANAIETFSVQPRNVGFMGPEVKSIFPNMGHMIGYAVTAKIAADAPPSAHMNVSRTEWVDEIMKVPGPRVLVLEDIDYPNPIGSFWGEVQANLHRALGAVGTVTNGGVRDLDEMQEVGFFAFASCVLVSHAYVHITDVGVPVKIGGLEVSSGDIIQGDQHGVIKVPRDIAAEIPDAVKRVENNEQEMIGYANSPEFTVEGLKEMLAQRY